MSAFVEGWRKGIHSKERVPNLRLSYNRYRHCIVLYCLLPRIIQLIGSQA